MGIDAQMSLYTNGISFCRGTVYPQDQSEPTCERLPPRGSKTLICPTAEQLGTLVGVLEKLDATVVSLGCGEGWLEGLLERADLDVVPVDIDLHRSKANHFTCGAGHYIHKCGCHARELSFCSPVNRVIDSEVFHIAEPPSSALLVPYGVGVPLESYLDRYKTLQAIVLIGDGDGAQNPMIDPHVLESQTSRWKVIHTQPIQGSDGKGGVLDPALLCVVYETTGED